MFRRAPAFVTFLVGLTVFGWQGCGAAEPVSAELDIKKHINNHAFLGFANNNPAVALNMLKWSIKHDQQAHLFIDLSKQIFRTWAGKDVAAAQSWLDRQITAQVFDAQWFGGSHNQATHFREELESQILVNLLNDDLTKIKERLAGMDQQLRINLIKNSNYWNVPTEKENALAQLVRPYFADQARLEFFAKQGALATFGDFNRVDEYLSTVDLLADEEKQLIESAAAASIGFIPCRIGGKITSAHITAMRNWLISKGYAKTVDRLTGENIAGAVFPKENIYYSEARENCINFAEACVLAEEFWKLSGKDDVLIGFLERSNPWESIDKATALAQKIADKEKRVLLLRKFNPQTMMAPVEKNIQ